MILDLRFISRARAARKFRREQWESGFRMQHWWFVWHPIIVNYRIIWLRWVKRMKSVKYEYILDPTPGEWADYSPRWRLFLGENPGRVEAQWSYM